MLDPSRARQRRQLVLALLVLATIDLLAYGKILGHAFVSYDDATYVYENRMVRSGLSLDAIAWAFDPRHGYAANWHPLTWLSHMLDVHLFGIDRPGAHLGMNLLLHVVNVWLLFLVLWRMTRQGAVGGTAERTIDRSLFQSAFVAALFGVHPLHVESVAWVAERKDVLSGLFWMLGMGAYAWYVARPGWKRMAAVASCLALGLMAKPMVVTFPFVLLLLDIWPLRRWSFGAGRQVRYAQWLALVREKLSLFALAAAASVLTYVAQEQGGAVNRAYPLGERLANGVAAYGAYLGRTFWPFDLAVFYPHGSSGTPMALLSALLLCAVTTLVIRQRRARPYLLMGWLWFLGTLVPVSGVFVQVGEQSMADRYGYLPLIGIFVMIAWGIPDLLAGWRRRRLTLGIAAGVAVAALTFLSWRQVDVWQDSERLFRHAARVTDDNAYAHAALGLELRRLARFDEALDACRRSVALDPADWSGQNCLALVLIDLDRLAEAAGPAVEAIRLAPRVAEPHAALGVILAREGRHAEAIVEYEAALRSDPEAVNTHLLLARSFVASGDRQAAIGPLGEAIRLEPERTDAMLLLADVLMQRGDVAEAKSRYRSVLALKPEHRVAANNLAWLLATKGDGGRDAAEAVSLAETACQAAESSTFLDTLAVAYASAGRFDAAVRAAERGIELARRENNPKLMREIEARLPAYRARRVPASLP